MRGNCRKSTAEQSDQSVQKWKETSLNPTRTKEIKTKRKKEISQKKKGGKNRIRGEKKRGGEWIRGGIERSYLKGRKKARGIEQSRRAEARGDGEQGGASDGQSHGAVVAEP